VLKSGRSCCKDEVKDWLALFTSGSELRSTQIPVYLRTKNCDRERNCVFALSLGVQSLQCSSVSIYTSSLGKET